MKKSLLLLLYISILCFSCGKALQRSHNFTVSRLDSLIVAENKMDQFHGSILVGSQDEIIYHSAIGLADRNWNIPVSLDTHFDVASLNKSFIAALVLLAVEESKLKLEDSLKDLLSNYQYQGNFDSNITIHHMLCHISGLPDYDSVNDSLSKHHFKAFKRLHFSNKGYVDFISQLPKIDFPNQQFYYSNFAYHLLCIILEDTYHTSFPELLKTKICQPLGLENTYSTTSNETIFPELAEAYNWNPDSKSWIKNNFIDLSLGRRIFSTSEDLYKWAKAMNNNQLLSPASLQQMQTNHLAHLTDQIAYGYGWAIFDRKGHYKMGNLDLPQPYIIHGGATEGYKSMLINIDHGTYIVAFLSNVGDQTNEMTLAKKIAHILTQH
ncbi:serine hydrolase [Echinicola sp. 20G]|uniref:serine hydrolase domain-containing protein n=1 Tax=Echinicola sp. 20G TaxID=2781961 RepID=UPI0019100865|nr:serine hydrolase domain-containing protein [Echinicola sp. 20G]